MEVRKEPYFLAYFDGGSHPFQPYPYGLGEDEHSLWMVPEMFADGW